MVTRTVELAVSAALAASFTLVMLVLRLLARGRGAPPGSGGTARRARSAIAISYEYRLAGMGRDRRDDPRGACRAAPLGAGDNRLPRKEAGKGRMFAASGG